MLVTESARGYNLITRSGSVEAMCAVFGHSLLIINQERMICFGTMQILSATSAIEQDRLMLSPSQIGITKLILLFSSAAQLCT
jgi:hypothetical protein